MKEFLLIILAGFFLASCNTDVLEFDNVEVQPITGIFSVPIGEMSYTMRELIEDQDDQIEFQEDPNTSLLTLFYNDTLLYDSEGEFIQIDDVGKRGVVTTIPPTMGPNIVTLNETFTRSYDTPKADDKLDSLFYNTGDLTFMVNSTIQGIFNYSFTFRDTRHVDSAVPITFSGTMNGAGSNTETRSLANHVTIFSDPLVSNSFDIDFTGSIELSSTQLLNGTEQISFDLQFHNQTFNTIYGKLGQDTVQIDNEEIDLDFFQEMGDEGIFFGNPILRCTFKNSFGIPISIDFSSLYGDDGNMGVRTFLSGAITETPLPEIQGADVNNPGSIAESTIEINRGNSSIINLLSTSPNRLVFDIRAISNVNSPNQTNFVQPGNKIEGYVTLEIPMEIRLENVSRTHELSLGDGLNTSNADSISMRILTENQFPFSGYLTIDIQDEDNNSIYTVAENLVIKAPSTGINGIVTSPARTVTDISLSQEGLEAFDVGTHVSLTFNLNTPVSQTSRLIYVKILANYQLRVAIGLTVKVDIDI